MNLYDIIERPDEPNPWKFIDEWVAEFVSYEQEERQEILELLYVEPVYLESLTLLTLPGETNALASANDSDTSEQIVKMFLPMTLGRYLNIRLIQQAVEQDDADKMSTGLIRAGSSAGLQILAHHRDDISVGMMRQLLPSAWTMPNLNNPPRGLTRAIALELFDKTGWITDGPDRPTTTTRLFHGARATGTEEEEGFDTSGWGCLSWTDDIDVARKFAAGGAVYVLDVEPADVLARFDDRSESEYVVDPEPFEPVILEAPTGDRSGWLGELARNLEDL